MIKRKIDRIFDEFYDINAREALLVDGARQVGKTFSIREFGKRHFKTVVEINFIKTKGARNLFDGIESVQQLLVKISALTDIDLEPGNTLIFFDEVQECPEIVTFIKFLVDEGSYRYVLSGSLLGVELKDLRSAPVGYLREVRMYPLDFEEFIRAVGVSSTVLDHVKDRLTAFLPIDPVVHEKMKGLFNLYLVVGGMPAAVDVYLRTNNIARVVTIQKGILDEYRKDASKYDKKNKLKIVKALEIVPEALNRRNKRFIVADIKQGSRYDREADTFLWLEEAGINLPVRAVTEPKVPLRLARRSNFFKLFLNDVGLLSALYMDGIQYRILSGETDVNFGAVYENFVAQELASKGFPLYYFNSEDRPAEVDFLIEKDGMCLPVEVKSGKNYKTHASLDDLLAVSDYRVAHALVISNANVSTSSDGRIRYLPSYYLMFLEHDGLPDETRFTPPIPSESDIIFQTHS